MVQNLPPKTVVNLITSDFEKAWKGLVKNEEKKARQPPMFFAFLAMDLLEYVCRLCKYDLQGFEDFSNNLYKTEKKYFIDLPLTRFKAKKDDFTLPHLRGQASDGLLLTVLFDTIRNGLGHQYQPSIINLKNGRKFTAILGGPVRDINVNARSWHLTCIIERNGDIRLFVCPEYLLRHIQKAIKESNLLDGQRGLKIKHGEFDCKSVSVEDLEASLTGGGVISRRTNR
ncbi:MAG: hypothetical protein ACRD8W_01475 [Nitrososphaeraceae archaeon]